MKGFFAMHYLALGFLLIALTACSSGDETILPVGSAEPASFGSGNFGRWTTDEDDLPAYSYTASCGEGACRWRYNGLLNSGVMETDLHWFQFGNGHIVAQGYNTGAVSVVYQKDLSYLLLNRHRPIEGLLGGGIVEITDGERVMITDYVTPDATETLVERTFGVGYFRKKVISDNVELDHIIFIPAGGGSFLVSLAQVNNRNNRTLTFTERWEGRPLVLQSFTPDEGRERFSDNLIKQTQIEGNRARFLYHDGPVPDILVQAVETTEGEFLPAGHEASVIWEAPLPPGESTFCIIYGPSENEADSLGSELNCVELWSESRKKRVEDIPVIEIPEAPWLARELKWAFAFLDQTFPFFGDGYRSGETYHSYTYTLGGSLGPFEEDKYAVLSRDQFQYAITLSPFDPDFARRLLEGGLVRVPKDPATVWWQIPVVIAASDHPLYLVWALAEYIYATQDFGFLDKELPYSDGGSGSVWEHALAAYRYLVDHVGLGPTGLVRVLGGDWNDAMVVSLWLVEGANYRKVNQEAESILNSAMAAYILPYAAPLAEHQGDYALAEEFRAWGGEMCDALAKEWNGSWYSRLRLHGTQSRLQGEIIGSDRMYLEPQPWLVNSGCSVEHGTTEALLDYIWEHFIQPSPLAAPLLIDPVEHDIGGDPGDGHDGGIWPILNGYLIWAYANHDPGRAWDLLKRNSLAYHAEAYPQIWTGIWGGFDAWNAWFSENPGWTWEQNPFYDMNAVPMGYPSPHFSQLGAFLQALGIHFTPDGPARIGSSIPGKVRLRTPVLEVDD